MSVPAGINATLARSAPITLNRGFGARDDRTFAVTLSNAARGKALDATRHAGIAASPEPANPLARPAKPREQRLREAAQQLVSSALLMPVLEQMEVSPLAPKTGPFARNIVEQRFGPMLHQHMADRIMQSRSFGLVDAVVQRLDRPAKRGLEMIA